MKMIRKAIALALTFLIGFTAYIPLTESAYAADDNITFYEGKVISWQEYNGHVRVVTKHNGQSLEKRSYIYCIEPGLKAPGGGTYTVQEAAGTSEKMQLMRKIIYYSPSAPGWGRDGVGLYGDLTEGSDKSLLATHMALSLANHGGWDATRAFAASINTIYANKMDKSPALKERAVFIYENVYRAPDPPAGFMAFMLEGGQKQDLFGYINSQSGKASLTKKSADSTLTEGNPCYSLEGAKYQVYTNAGCTVKATDITGNNAIFTTNADGSANTIDLYTGTYYVKEVKAPEGYAADLTVHEIKVEADKKATFESVDEPAGDPAFLTLFKYDSDLNETMNQQQIEENFPAGSASLEGAIYSLDFYAGQYDSEEEALSALENNPNLSHRHYEYISNSKGWINFANPSYLLEGEPYMVTDDGFMTFPIGTLIIKEKTAPEGYLLDTNVYVRNIVHNADAANQGIPTINSNNEIASPEPVIRGDLSFVKMNEKGEKMAGVPFLITSVATGESHVVVTDSQGEVNTADGDYSEGINLNDPAARGSFEIKYNEDGTVKKVKTFEDHPVNMERITEGAGIWFSGDTPRNAGALPFDTYIITELPCEINYAYTLVSFEATVTENQRNYQAGAILNKYKPSIGTVAKAGDGKIAKAEGNVTITDTVSYDNLRLEIEGETAEYEMRGILMDKDTGRPLIINGSQVTAVKNFTPDDEDGEITMEFTFDASELAGKSVVVFEYLYGEGEDGEEIIIAAHEDITDENQTIIFPAIGTSANGTDSDVQLVEAKKNAKITDTVTYSNLALTDERGNPITYTLTATLMNKETGEAVRNGFGNPVTETKSFRPQAESGTVDITLTFDAHLLAGCDVVCFESLEMKTGLFSSEEIAEHKDLEDADQTVHIPDIGTEAIAEDTQANITGASENIVIIDTVRYENLIPGLTYTMKGKLMNKYTGRVIRDDEGVEVTAEKTFTPDTESGFMSMEFRFSGSNLAGQNLVAFEECEYDGVAVGRHEDLNDESQTIHIPDIGTKASASGYTKVTDIIAYENLIPGKTYTLRGVLVNKETGEILPDSEREMDFVPAQANGTVEMEFEVKEADVKGKSFVVFEKLFLADAEIASHEDINSKPQTVNFPGTPQTGMGFPWIIGALLLLAVGAGAFLFRRKINTR